MSKKKLLSNCKREVNNVYLIKKVVFNRTCCTYVPKLRYDNQLE